MLRPVLPQEQTTVMKMAKKSTMTDEELAEHFENFDFDNAVSVGRNPLRALHWAAQFHECIDDQLVDIVREAPHSGRRSRRR